MNTVNNTVPWSISGWKPAVKACTYSELKATRGVMLDILAAETYPEGSDANRTILAIFNAVELELDFRAANDWSAS